MCTEWKIVNTAKALVPNRVWTHNSRGLKKTKLPYLLSNKSRPNYKLWGKPENIFSAFTCFHPLHFFHPIYFFTQYIFSSNKNLFFFKKYIFSSNRFFSFNTFLSPKHTFAFVLGGPLWVTSFIYHWQSRDQGSISWSQIHVHFNKMMNKHHIWKAWK